MKPSTLKTLRLLERNESVTTHDLLLAGCGSRYGARIHELRQEGYDIEEERLPDRSGSRYRLLRSPVKVVESEPEAVPEGQLEMFPAPVRRTSHYDIEAA